MKKVFLILALANAYSECSDTNTNLVPPVPTQLAPTIIVSQLTQRAYKKKLDHAITTLMSYAQDHKLYTPALQQLHEFLQGTRTLKAFTLFYESVQELAQLISKTSDNSKTHCREIISTELRKHVNQSKQQEYTEDGVRKALHKALAQLLCPKIFYIDTFDAEQLAQINRAGTTGLMVGDNKFTVSKEYGDTVVGGTLSVAGTSALTGQVTLNSDANTYKFPTNRGTSGQMLQLTDESGTLAWQSGGAGDVTGPASSVDNEIVIFNGTTGKVIKKSNVLLDPSTGSILPAPSNALKTITINNSDDTELATTIGKAGTTGSGTLSLQSGIGSTISVGTTGDSGSGNLNLYAGTGKTVTITAPTVTTTGSATTTILGSTTATVNSTGEGSTMLGNSTGKVGICGAVDATTKLNVTGTSKFSDQLTVTANGASITGTTGITGATTIAGTTLINDASAGNAGTSINTSSGSGAVAIGNADSTITVLGTTTINDSGTKSTTIGVSGTGAVTLGNSTGKVGICGAVDGTAKLNVTGTSKFSDQLTVTANGASITGTTGITGATTIAGTTLINDASAGNAGTSINTSSGSGAVAIGNADSTITVLGTTTINDSGTKSTTIGVSGTGAVTLGNSTGKVGICGAVDGTAKLNVTGTSKFSDQLTVTANGASITGTTGITGATTIAGTTLINDASAGNAGTSINTSSGSGAVAIGNADSTITVLGTTTINDSGTKSTTIGVSGTGAVTLGNSTGKVGICGAVDATAKLNVTGTSKFSDQLTVTANGASITGTTGITGNTTITSGTFTLPVGTATAPSLNFSGSSSTGISAIISGLIGSETKINTTSITDAPAISSNSSDGTFITTWRNTNASGIINLQRFDANGSPSGSETAANDSDHYARSSGLPSIAQLGSGTFVITWVADDNLVYAQRFNADGSKNGDVIQVNGSSQVAAQGFACVAARESGKFVVSWIDTSHNVQMQRFNADGSTQGTLTQVNTSSLGSATDYGSPGITTLASGNFVIAWFTNTGNNLYMQQFDTNGTTIGSETKVNTDSSVYNSNAIAITSLANGTFVIAWRSYSSSYIYMQRFNSSGAKLGAETQVNSSASLRTGITPAITVTNNSNYAVTWIDGSNNVYLRVFNSSGTPNTTLGEVKVNTSQTATNYANSPVAYLGNYVVAVTWFYSTSAAYVQRLYSIDNSVCINAAGSTQLMANGAGCNAIGDLVVDGTLSVNDFSITDLTVTNINGLEATTTSIGYTGGTNNITGTTNINVSNNNTTNINTGTSTATVNIANGSGANTVSIGNDNSTLSLTGSTSITGPETTLFDTPTLLISQASGTSCNPALAKLNNNNIIMTWVNSNVLYGIIYDSTMSTIVKSTFTISGSDVSSDTSPSVIVLTGGRFVAAWNSASGESNRTAYFQIYGQDGTSIGTATSATSNSGPYQRPCLAALTNGNFVIAWADTSQGDLYGEICDPDGTVQVETFRIGDQWASVLGNSTLTGLTNGNFVAICKQSGSGNRNLYGRILTNTGSEAVATFAINDTSSYPPDYATNGIATLSDGKFAVAWLSNASNPTNAFLRIYNNDGTAATSIVTITDSSTLLQSTSGIQLATFSDNSIAATWTTNTNYVTAQYYNESGTATTNYIQTNQNYPNTTDYPSVVILTSDSPYITWRSAATNNPIYGAQISNAGQPITLTGSIQLNGSSNYTTTIGNTTNGGAVAIEAATGSSISLAHTADMHTDVNIGDAGLAAAGTQTINIGIGTLNHASAAKTINIGTGTNTNGTRTVNIGASGAAVNSNGTTKINENVNSNTSINTGTSTGTVTIGNSANGGTVTMLSDGAVTINNADNISSTITLGQAGATGHGSGAVGIQSGLDYDITIGTTGSNPGSGSLNLYAGTGKTITLTAPTVTTTGSTTTNILGSTTATVNSTGEGSTILGNSTGKVGICGAVDGTAKLNVTGTSKFSDQLTVTANGASITGITGVTGATTIAGTTLINDTSTGNASTSINTNSGSGTVAIGNAQTTGITVLSDGEVSINKADNVSATTTIGQAGATGHGSGALGLQSGLDYDITIGTTGSNPGSGNLNLYAGTGKTITLTAPTVTTTGSTTTNILGSATATVNSTGEGSTILGNSTGKVGICGTVDGTAKLNVTGTSKFSDQLTITANGASITGITGVTGATTIAGTTLINDTSTGNASTSINTNSGSGTVAIGNAQTTGITVLSDGEVSINKADNVSATTTIGQAGATGHGSGALGLQSGLDYDITIGTTGSNPGSGSLNLYAGTGKTITLTAPTVTTTGSTTTNILGATTATVNSTGTGATTIGNSTGCVGIGGTPTASSNMLQVTGSTAITGNVLLPTTTSTTGQIKVNEQPFLHSYGNYNLFMGENAGNFTLDAVNAKFNAGIGFRALAGVTTGAYNMSFGADTLPALTTGLANTAIGHGSQYRTTEGNHNVGIGDQTLNNITTHNENVAIGNNACEYFTASYNTAVGSQALRGSASPLSTGAGNVAIGYNSLTAITTGSNNTGVGTSTLTGITTGGSNVCIGSSAGNALNSAAFGNTAIGASALSAGGRYNNTCIGLSAGSGYTGTEENNICIGYNVTGTASESNVIRIGDTQTTCYIKGIYDTSSFSGEPVVVASTGQLGRTTSSRRFKENINDIGNESTKIAQLHPVTFNYKKDTTKTKQYGLIAEEVQEILPELVNYDKGGQPEGVRYQHLPILLLKEVQKQQKKLDEQEQKITTLLNRIEKLEHAMYFDFTLST